MTSIEGMEVNKNQDNRAGYVVSVVHDYITITAFRIIQCLRY